MNDPEEPKIEFPEGMPVKNIVMAVNLLQNKLSEYRQRLQLNPHDLGTRYKLELVEALLSNGEVKTQELSMRLERELGRFDLDAFINACEVVVDYVNTGGQNIIKGI